MQCNLCARRLRRDATIDVAYIYGWMHGGLLKTYESALIVFSQNPVKSSILRYRLYVHIMNRMHVPVCTVFFSFFFDSPLKTTVISSFIKNIFL